MNFMARLRFLHRAWKAQRRDERAEIQALRSLVRPGDTVVDIGAHKGSYLYWLRRAAGDSGQVIACEPKLVFPGKGVVGVENTWRVTASGLERITVSDDALVSL